MAYVDEAERYLTGTLLEWVARRDHSWDFRFSNGSLAVEHIWRLWIDGKLVVTDREDGLSYGGPTVLDAEAMASELLVGRKILAAFIDRETTDLRISFEGGARLEVLTKSRITSWTFSGPSFAFAAENGRVTDPGWFLSSAQRT